MDIVQPCPFRGYNKFVNGSKMVMCMNGQDYAGLEMEVEIED